MDHAEHDESRRLWEEHAGWWIERFTAGADPEYEEQILPLAQAELVGAAAVLDVGCGEGQLSRRLAGEGRLVVGADPTRHQLDAARARAGGPAYARAAADRLPFADASFDAVVACLVFEHIDAIDESFAEIARVLRPDGRFAFFLNHPVLQTPSSGWIEDHTLDPPESYWRLGPYLTEAEFTEQVEKGVFIRFIHRPLSRYVNLLADHGLRVERMIEPAPPPGFLDRADAYRAAAAYPRLLYLRLRRE